MKSLEVSTTINTLLTTTSCDDSDDELGAEIYRSSLTAKRHREEQNASSSKNDTKSKEGEEKENTKSKEDAKKEKSIVCSKPISTDTKNTKRVIKGRRQWYQ